MISASSRYFLDIAIGCGISVVHKHNNTEKTKKVYRQCDNHIVINSILEDNQSRHIFKIIKLSCKRTIKLAWGLEKISKASRVPLERMTIILISTQEQTCNSFRDLDERIVALNGWSCDFLFLRLNILFIGLGLPFRRSLLGCRCSKAPGLDRLFSQWWTIQVVKVGDGEDMWCVKISIDSGAIFAIQSFFAEGTCGSN